jgi:MATE family multidrug resistance protein
MVMALQLGGLLLKLPLNALLIFGGLGLPAFGGPGCAIATTVIAWLMMIAAWLLVARLPLYRPLKLFGSGFVAPSWKASARCCGWAFRSACPISSRSPPSP